MIRLVSVFRQNATPAGLAAHLHRIPV